MGSTTRARSRAARTLGILATVLLAGCGGVGSRPNGTSLLVVSIDTLRADHLSSYGYERETSPRLDALAAEGRRFEDAWTVMATTTPAHASLFTSLYPREAGPRANGMRLPPSASTLAERLRARGFATGGFVSAIPLHPMFGLEQGFDVYDHPAGEERPGDATRARAEQWLRARGDERFFCFVHLFDPHTWYTAPAAQRAPFGAPAGQQPSERDFLDAPGDLTADARQAAIDAYDAEIRFADEQLGALLDALERHGLAQRTIVLVVSDHGETLDELIDTFGYGFDHGEFLRRRELRVPLVLRVPPALPGHGPAVHAEPVSILDVMPTLLELLDVPCEPPALGRSLVPLLEGAALPERPRFAERRVLTRGERTQPPSPLLAGPELSVTTGRWHHVSCVGRPPELFDLAADPEERDNVAAQQPEVTARLAALLEAWRELHVQAHDAGLGPVDPELLQGLRALGYAADDPR